MYIYIFQDVCSSQANVPKFITEQRRNGNSSQHKADVTNEGRLVGYFYFCSNTVFNLNRKILTDIEIKVLEKRLVFAQIQNKIIEPELRSDFAEFLQRIRTK